MMTLWKVDDRSSSRFVSAFCQRVAKGVPPLQALAATKREVASSSRYGHPFHWAGFVMYGGRAESGMGPDPRIGPLSSTSHVKHGVPWPRLSFRHGRGSIDVEAERC